MPSVLWVRFWGGPDKGGHLLAPVGTVKAGASPPEWHVPLTSGVLGLLGASPSPFSRDSAHGLGLSKNGILSSSASGQVKAIFRAGAMSPLLDSVAQSQSQGSCKLKGLKREALTFDGGVRQNHLVVSSLENIICHKPYIQ